MLLREVVAIRHLDLDLAGVHPRQLGADGGHDLLPGKARPDAGFEIAGGLEPDRHSGLPCLTRRLLQRPKTQAIADFAAQQGQLSHQIDAVSSVANATHAP